MTELFDQSDQFDWSEAVPPYLLISPLPEAACEEDDGDWGLQVGADGLDVDKKLPTLTGLDDRNPQHGHHHQHKHKYPAAHI